MSKTMNVTSRTPRLSLVVIASVTVLIATAADAQSTTAKRDSPASGVIGTWRLKSFVEERPNGQLVPSGRYGPNVAGLLVYDSAGNMMAQLVNPDRPRFAAENATRGTPEEVKAAFDGYNAYFGTYTVDETASTIRHHVVANLFPNAVGTEFVRKFKLDGDRLSLELPPMQIQGEQRTVRLVWQRAR